MVWIWSTLPLLKSGLPSRVRARVTWSIAPEAARIRQVYCNSMDFDHTPFAHKADLIFIDAGHAYECVCSDSAKSLVMIAPGGVILWHDYHYAHEGVFRCLNELAAKVELFAIPNTKFACHVSPKAV